MEQSASQPHTYIHPEGARSADVYYGSLDPGGAMNDQAVPYLHRNASTIPTTEEYRVAQLRQQVAHMNSKNGEVLPLNAFLPDSSAGLYHPAGGGDPGVARRGADFDYSSLSLRPDAGYNQRLVAIGRQLHAAYRAERREARAEWREKQLQRASRFVGKLATGVALGLGRLDWRADRRAAARAQ